MISLATYALLFVASLLTVAAAMAWAARRAGSPRGRFPVSLGVALLLYVLNAAVSYAASYLPVDSERLSAATAVAANGGLFLVQLLLIFLVIRNRFRLSAGRAFAPFGAYLAVIVGYLLVAALAVRPNITEAFTQYAASMEPTVAKGDRLSVNKLLPPRRWDLVAYVNDGPPRATFCKRLVGLPGERIRFDGGTVYVNDQPLQAPPVVAGQYRASLSRDFRPKYRDGETIQLGPEQFFFVGDNVEISGDSRLNGPSDRSRIVGVVDVIYWPPGRARVVR